jgi:predicted secreted protein
MTRALVLLLAVGALPGFAETPPQYNRVSLSESAQTDIDNDQLVAVLFAQAEGREAAAAADQVNRVMDWAVTLVKAHPEVKVQTLGYRTQPIYSKNNIRGWRAQQSLRLEANDSGLMGDLTAKLQEQLQVQSLTYQVSDEQRRARLDELTAAALRRFQERARHITRTLGRGDYRIVRIAINDGHQPPVPIARGMMMEAARADVAVAPARIEAGTQQITVSVSGEIELSED